jgi:hypothetical protein
VVSDSSIKYIVGGSWSRTNYEDLTFRRMRLTNLARIGTGVAGWTHAFACKFSGDNSEGQTIYARRITFEDIRVEGGNSAIEVAGYLNGTTAKLNTGVVDDVTVDGWYHDTGVVPTAFKTSQHVLVGGSAIGGRCRIANGYGFNSGDVGVEYDSMQSVEIDNVFIQDSWTAGFFGASLNDPTSPKTQLWTHKDCTARRVNVLAMRGFRTNALNSTTTGRAHYKSCTFESLATALPTGSNQHAFEFGGKMRGARLDSCVSVTSGFTHTAGTNTQPRAINWLAVPPDEGPSTLEIDGFVLSVAGSVASSGTWYHYGVVINAGASVALSVANLTVDDSGLTRAGSPGVVTAVSLGTAAGSATVKGSVDKVNVQALSKGSVVEVYGTMNLTLSSVFTIRNVDTTHISGTAAVVTYTSGSQNSDKILVDTGVAAAPVIANATPSDQAAVAWTIDPATCATSAFLTAGVVSLVRCKIPTTTPVNSIMVHVGTAGSGLTTGQCFAAIFDSTGATQLGITDDLSADGAGNNNQSFASTGWKTIPLTTPIASLTGGSGVWVYIALLANGTTMPKISCAATLSSSLPQLGIGASTGYRTGTFGTGQTAMPSSITKSSMSPSTNTYALALK